MPIRGHSPSSRSSIRLFAAGHSRWRRWAGTRKRWRRRCRTSRSRRFCCRGPVVTRTPQRRWKRRNGKRKRTRTPRQRPGALLTSSWLSIERAQYARALEELRAVEAALGQQTNHSLLVLADLVGGVAELRAGNLANAATRLGSQKARHDRDDRAESNWVAALEGEIALAQGQYDRAMSSFKTARIARVAHARKRHPGRVRHEPAFSRRTGPGRRCPRPPRGGGRRIQTSDRCGPWRPVRACSSHVTCSRWRVCWTNRETTAGARVEYQRFLTLWANADQGLPEIEEARRAVSACAPKVRRPRVIW